MIRTDVEYKRSLDLLEALQHQIEATRAWACDQGCTADEAESAADPIRNMRVNIEQEVHEYEGAHHRSFPVIHRVSSIGRLLILLRIAHSMSQKELADKLGVSEAQVSRDE